MRLEPKKIIKTYKERSASKNAKILRIHKATVYRWLIRARSIYNIYSNNVMYSTRGLRRHSTKPKRIRYRLTNKERVEIERLREEF